MNPCRCGNTGTPNRPPANGPERYVGRIQAARDRPTCGRMPSCRAALITDTEPEPSATVAARIAVAREVQLARHTR
jgi:predicted ATPase with chaperone activity